MSRGCLGLLLLTKFVVSCGILTLSVSEKREEESFQKLYQLLDCYCEWEQKDRVRHHFIEVG